MFGKFFNPDNKFFIFMGKVFDILALSVLWLLTSFPILTIGASSTALYDCCYHNLRQDESGVFSRYFRTFKNNFILSLLSSLVILLAAIGSYYWYGIVKIGASTGNEILKIIMYAAPILLFLVIGVIVWLYPLLSRFHVTFKGLWISALKLAIGFLPYTVLLVLIVIASLALSYIFMFPIFFMPAVAAWTSTFLIERVFKRVQQANESPNEAGKNTAEDFTAEVVEVKDDK